MTNAIRLLVTAGPTAEDIDAVRFLTNRSTGKMGIAIAQAAIQRGWDVRLVLGPTHLEPPAGVLHIPVRSAKDMLIAVQKHFDWCDALVMAAAVADYTPAEPVDGKRKKEPGDWILRLVRTADILAEIAGRPDRPTKTVVGFSLGVEMDLAEARRKLRDKRLDAIVANTARSFGAAEADAVILDRDGGETALGTVTKAELSARLLDEIARLRADSREAY